MNILDLFKKHKRKTITKEIIALSSLAKVPTKDYFKDNNQFLDLINYEKNKYLEILLKEKVLTSKELTNNDIYNKMNMLHSFIEQNTLDEELFEKVIFDEEDKVKALVKIRKFAIYNERIKELEEEVISKIIALKEILNKIFLNRQKRISIINEINNLTNVYVILMNQKEALSLCLNSYGLKCFKITKEVNEEKEKEIIKVRVEELKKYQDITRIEKIEINSLVDIAKVEIEIEEYVYENKDKVKELKGKLETIVSLEKLEELEKEYKIYYEFGKRLIIKEDLQELYKKKFRILTSIKNGNNESLIINPFINDKTPKLEIETYEEMIFELINNLSIYDDDIFSIRFEFKKDTNTLLRLLKKELQINGKYEALEILKNKYKLNLLLAVTKPIKVGILRDIYKRIYVKKGDYPDVDFYEERFEWNEELPLETINELKLMQNKKDDLGLYLFLKKYYHTYGYHSFYYYLPKGLKKVKSYHPSCTTKVRAQEIEKFMEVFIKNMNGKEVILPKTLKNVYGDIFGNADIYKLQLNKELEHFDVEFLPKSNVRKIVIPATVASFSVLYGSTPISGRLEQIRFLDFDKSIFYNIEENLYNLLDPYIIPYTETIEGKIINYYDLAMDELYFSYSNGINLVIKKGDLKTEYTIEGAYYKLKFIEKLNQELISVMNLPINKKKNKNRVLTISKK